MDISTKKARSQKNAEKRRERSKVAARCRRGKESEIFSDLSTSLPIPVSAKATLDKASIMRLTLCNLKIKKMKSAIERVETTESESDLLDLEGLLHTALGGFIIALTLDAEVVYASEGISGHLGICQYEIMGQNLLDFTHQYDQHELRSLLKGDHGGVQDKRSALLRLKCTASSRGKNAHMRSSNFKVVNCIGRIVQDAYFVAICEPLLHPVDVDIPLNKQSFLSKHRADMKFEYVDEAIGELMGYDPSDLVGKSLFDFTHAADGEGILKSFKGLYEKEQGMTGRYRFLCNGGGWMWIITQATVINQKGGSGTGAGSIVCIHFVTSGIEEEGLILSEIQMGPVVATKGTIAPAPTPTKEARNENPKPSGIQMHTMSTDDENDFIADLLIGPLLNNATSATKKIFAPRTEDMDTGFLMPVDEGLLSKDADDPDDLTHLAPIAGDECVPLDLDVPLLEDLLASLDEVDGGYTVLNGDSEEIPSTFDMMMRYRPKKGGGGGGGTDPESPMVVEDPLFCGGINPSPSSLEMVLSPPQQPSPEVTAKFHPLEPDPLSFLPNSNKLKIPRDSGPQWELLEEANALINQGLEGGPSPSKIGRYQQQQQPSDTQSKIYILVPVRQGGKHSESSNGSDESSNDSNLGGFNLAELIQGQDNEVQQLQIKQLLSNIIGVNLDRGESSGGRDANRRKRDFTGSLLSGERRLFSLQELTRQDCEVNAPLRSNSDLLQGPELLSALEADVLP